MEETKENTPPTETPTVSEEPKQPEKKKRKLTPTQLATLAEGRRKRWEKKTLKIDIPEKEVQIKEEKTEEKPPEIKKEYVSSANSDTEPSNSSDEDDDISIGGNSPPYSRFFICNRNSCCKFRHIRISRQ